MNGICVENLMTNVHPFIYKLIKKKFFFVQINFRFFIEIMIEETTDVGEVQ